MSHLISIKESEVDKKKYDIVPIYFAGRVFNTLIPKKKDKKKKKT
jgi:hypothetical protein